jgi:hypothetical protein
MRNPFGPITAPQERSALCRLSLDDLKVRLGAYAIAEPDTSSRASHVATTVPDCRRSRPGLDDWSGSFDMHLGVYTTD